MDVQSLFNQLNELRKEQKEIKKEYRDALVQMPEYEKVLEDYEKIREQKQMYEQKAKGSLGTRYERLEELSDEIKSNQEMLSDIAMTTLMDGKTVEATDEYGNKYEPIFSVRLKKLG